MLYEAETAMKNLIKIIIFTSFSYCHALAGIQLDWEYTVGENDFSPIAPSNIDPLMPPQHGITAIKVGATGYAAVVLERAPYSYIDEGSNTSVEYDREIRFAMLNSQGNRIWLSNNLVSIFDQYYNLIIISVTPDSATFSLSSMNEIAICSFNLNATPQFSQLTLTNQRIALNINSGGAPGTVGNMQGESFPPNTFYTVNPNFMGSMISNSLGTAIRKYSLNTLSTIRPVVASESGINGTNFVIRWQSTSNIGYQVQESTDMQTWTDVGQPIVGNGAIMSWSASIGTGNKFYRIVQL